jgi:hypothetical protein
MELPGRCGDWLDTDTVTVQGFTLRLDTTSKGWGLYLATSGDLQMATCGDFRMDMDSSCLPQRVHAWILWKDGRQGGMRKVGAIRRPAVVMLHSRAASRGAHG